MIRVSKKTEYALRALVQVGCELNTQSPLSIPKIAKAAQIPTKFLEQILLSLKNAGLLSSKRGTVGGYSLLRPLSKISLLEVIRIFEGPLSPWPCLEKNDPRSCSCPQPETCPIRLSFQKIYPLIQESLETTNIDQIVDQIKLLQSKSQEAPHYSI